MDAAPPPPPKTRIRVFKALYNYTATAADQLSFSEGDLLYVSDCGGENTWWPARCGARSGLIPSNYVAEHAEPIDFPLHEAAKRGNLAFLGECLENKVSVNGLDKSSSTPLYWAAHGGWTEAVALLLRQPSNKLGDTPLHAAAWKGHTECVRQLLEAGIDATIRNASGRTALDLATDPQAAALIQQALKSSSNDRQEEEYVSSDED